MQCYAFFSGDVKLRIRHINDTAHRNNHFRRAYNTNKTNKPSDTFLRPYKSKCRDRQAANYKTNEEIGI